MRPAPATRGGPFNAGNFLAEQGSSRLSCVLLRHCFLSFLLEILFLDHYYVGGFSLRMG